ncbi:DNA polymerase IV, partial [Ruminococcus sp. AF21-3]
DEIRRRFGYFSIQRAAMYQDKVLSHLDAGTHTIHPHSYFHG